MNETQLKTVAQLRTFLNGTLAVELQPIGEDSLRYEHIAAVLRRLEYRRLKRPDKGVVLRYLERTTGYYETADEFQRALMIRIADPAPPE